MRCFVVVVVIYNYSMSRPAVCAVFVVYYLYSYWTQQSERYTGYIIQIVTGYSSQRGTLDILSI